MSKQTELLQLDRCIVSRLWYTAMTIHQRELSDRCRHRRDVKKLKHLIETCAEQGSCENKWIAYNLSSQIENDEDSRKSLIHEEFVSTLKLLDAQVPHHTQEELLRLFKAIRTAGQKTDVPTCQLSQESIQCLEDNMMKYPTLIHWIINGLLCLWLPTSFAQTDLVLQDVYFSCLKRLLQEFLVDAIMETDEKTISLGLQKKNNVLKNEHLSILVSILSKVDLTDAKEDEMLAWLYPALLESTNFDYIELALYSRKNPKFFKAWHQFLDDTYARYNNPDNLENALKISRLMFTFDEHSIILLNANEIFKGVLRRRSHWLMDILDICYEILMSKRYNEVEQILNTPVLKDFWLLLLFKLLNDCQSALIFPIVEKCEDSTAICRALSFVLEKSKIKSWNEPTLQRLNNNLENHLKVLDWILEDKKLASTSDSISSKVAYPNFSVKQTVNFLDSHSTLAVLKMTTNIHEKSYSDIQTLLNDTDNSKNVFQAYYTMLCALKGILICEFYNTKYQQVAGHFDDMEKSLGSLFPLDLRLEVIENIFSMMFLRYEDFVEVDSSSDIGEEDSQTKPTESATKKKDSISSATGFVCNKYATREILIRLKRSITTVELECAEQKRDRRLSIETCDQIQNSVALVSKCISDAIWRLELLTSAEFIDRRGMPDTDNPRMSLSHDTSLFVDRRFHYATNTKIKTIFYKPNESSSDESEVLKSDLDGSSEAGSQGNATNNSSRRRKRSKNQSLLTETSSMISRDSKKRERTLNCMLVSKKSLVLQCLWKSDYDRASQVIKIKITLDDEVRSLLCDFQMFGLKNSPLDGEIVFSRAMRGFRKELRAQWTNSDTVDSSDLPTKQSTLENIRRAVHGGFQSSRTTGQIETFLAAQESSARLLNSNSITAKEILTMAAMDLALTMSRTYQDSVNLSDVAMKYIKSCKKLAKTRYYSFFESVYQLIYENKPELSMNEILCDARIPLSVNEAREKNGYWSNLMKKLEILRQSECQYESDIDASINENTSDPRERIFEDVISICENGEFYLPRVHAHLKILRTIVPEDKETLVEHSQLLETDLHTYIGDQIFRLNVELDEIESIASRLQVNLVHSILVNCCPKLSCFNGVSYNDIETRGTRVLNKNWMEDPSDRNSYEPNQCVMEILSELMDVLRSKLSPARVTLQHQEAGELSDDMEIHNILEKTGRLATLDLSNLSFGHHTLAFFINVWNLLMIHAMLEIWSKDPPIDELRHEISLAAIGYDIGDLGTVSLSTLRSKLLGQSTFHDSRYFPQTEELNEPAWQDLDVPHEPKVIFAMINEYEDSPIVRVYGRKTLDDDLKTAMSDYLEHHVTRQANLNLTNERVVYVPKLVQRYGDLMAKRSNSSSSPSVPVPLEEIMDDLNIPKLDAKVSIKPSRCSYKIHFSYINDESVRSEEVCKTVGTANDEFPWQSRIVTPNLLQYLEGHCWLLSYLVQRIHEESPTIHDSNCENLGRTAALENLLKSSWASNLKCLYENNQIVAGLWKIALTNDVWIKFETLLKNDEITKCLEIVNALPDSLITNNIEIQRFKDKILAKLANASRDQSINETMKCIYRIKDEQTLAQVILTNVNDLPVKVCQEALAHVLSYRNKEKLPSHCKSRMNEILCRLTVFRKMLPYCAKKSDEDDDSWHDVVYQTEKTNPMRIVRSLIDANQYELCLEWLEYQAVSSEIHSLITQDLLVGLLTNDDHDFKHALKLLRALPAKKSINLCNGVIVKLESISALRFVVGYLLEHTSPNESERYRRGLLGIDILEQLEIKERRSYIHLIEQPLLMLEQLLMNCRLDNLQRIVVAIREEPNNSLFCSESFDEIVRFYSKKSLDFRVAVQGDAMERIKEVSVSSTKRESGVFVMPLDIPTKEEWVPNDKARECSCCHVVIFSMFNRRHHCRRCGRVVCANCSPQRMRLPTYPNSVPVRICNDCKRQTLVQMQQAQGAPSTPSSETFDCWRLNVDEAHNKTLRDEFSFEHAPNISLCLAILNLHSDHEAYSNFLLDRCDEMKDLLRPDSKGRVNPEIDHGLIIKMIRSLLVAAKVKCAKLGLNTGLAHCDRFLSQVDLITTLVNSDCSYLIPRTGKDDHLDDHTLRRLRDSLTEKEQWIIALDVSTKTGLDSQGVWAAWGTACLKVGYYEQARDKFTHCLEKVLREDSDDWVMLSYPGESGVKRDSWSLPSDNLRRRTTSSKSQEGLKNRPVKDPPLLTEILQILERTNPNNMYGNYGLKSKAGSTQDIMNTLNRLKNLTEEYNTIGQPTVCTKDVRYEESLYYLLMYGSFSSILEFFIRHGKYEICLAYILENDIDPELFMNSVFLRCLRTGTMANLCEAMRAKDSNLVAFKKYLMFTCHSLERKQLLHTLLQLQLFMKDYVRASMTCIRFYVTDAKTYEDLCSRTHHLVEAQKHLESELQLESFGKKRRKSVSSSYSGQYSLTLEMHPIEIDRHMNTISRQMEIAKFLGNRQQEGKLLSEFMNTLAYMDSEGNSTRTVPTLFGNQQEKSHLAVLAILCGHDVEEGFGIAFRIMQDYNLRPQKIYSLVGHILALNRQITSIEQLIKCCRSSGAPNSNAISDRVLAHCVKLLLDLSRADPNPSPKDQIDALIRIITDVELKIESYIESRQLKAAYLLAVKHSRAQDIRKILKEADRLGQLAIKSICTKWLQQTQRSKNELG